MRNEFSHRSLHGHPRARKRLLVLTILILVLFGTDLISGGAIRGMIRSVAASVWSASGAVRSSITNTGYFSSRRALAEENAALRSQLAEFQERAAGYAVVTSENAELRAMLNLASRERGITAPVVSSFRASPYGTFLIGAGTNDAAPGSLVITEGGFVVGRVADVNSRTALVNALFAADVETEAHVGNTPALVEGQGGGNARATVPRSASVSVGDTVTAPALGGRAIGVVGNVASDPTGADQTIHVRLPVNIDALKYVYIVALP